MPSSQSTNLPTYFAIFFSAKTNIGKKKEQQFNSTLIVKLGCISASLPALDGACDAQCVPLHVPFNCLSIIGPSKSPISRVHTSLFGCLALEVTEFASPRAEKDLGLMSVMGAGSTGTMGSLASAPYPLLWALRRRSALGGDTTEAERSLQRGCSGMLKRCTVRKTPQVSAEKK